MSKRRFDPLAWADEARLVDEMFQQLRQIGAKHGVTWPPGYNARTRAGKKCREECLPIQMECWRRLDELRILRRAY